MFHIHPDLVQTWVRRVTYTAANTEKYEVYPHSAYVLSARITPILSTNQFGVVIYTSESPDNVGDDIPKLALYADSAGSPDDMAYAPGLLFMKGIYAATESATDGDEAYLQVRFVDRRHYCLAYPSVHSGLIECWNEARNKGLSTSDSKYQEFLENFDFYERDNPANAAGVEELGDGTLGDPI